MPYKDIDDSELNGPHTLAKFAERVAPRTYHHWLKTTELLGPTPLQRAMGVSDASLDSTLEWTADGGISFYGPRWKRRRQIKERREMLFERLSDYLRDAIASTRFATAAIGPAGTMIEVSWELANQAVIDIERNTLSTPDGGIVWRAVTVRTVPAAAAGDIAAKGRSVSPAVGRPRAWDWDGALAYLAAVADTDGLPEVQAKAVEMVEDYFADRNDGNYPANSAIRAKVSKVYSSVAELQAQDQKRPRRP